MREITHRDRIVRSHFAPERLRVLLSVPEVILKKDKQSLLQSRITSRGRKLPAINILDS